MNDTTTDQQAATPPPPHPPPPHQDLDRLRRSTSDRYIAGVAGGLGRHFGIDPTVLRVLLAVLAFFGGAGVLLYGVCWLFVPEDGEDRAPIHVGSEPRKLLLLAAGAIAFLLAVGDAFSGFNAGWPIASLAIIVAIVLIARDKKADRAANQYRFPTDPAAPPSWAGATDQTSVPSAGTAPSAGTPPAPAGPAPSGSQSSTESGGQYSSSYEYSYEPPRYGPVPPAPTAWQPPLVPPRPKRSGIIWFWPTLALIAIALGTLGVVDSNSSDIAAWAYPATAVAITGVMLLVGSVVGRPGGLILIGVVSTMALSFATVLGGFHFDGRDINEAPATAAAVQPEYTAHNGRIQLDLTKVADPAALAGRTIDISLKAGEIEVIVPRSLNVEIDAEFDFAGGIRVPGYDGGGIQDSVERRLTGVPATTTPALELDLEATVGQITVEQR